MDAYTTIMNMQVNGAKIKETMDKDISEAVLSEGQVLMTTIQNLLVEVCEWRGNFRTTPKSVGCSGCDVSKVRTTGQDHQFWWMDEQFWIKSPSSKTTLGDPISIFNKDAELMEKLFHCVYHYLDDLNTVVQANFQNMNNSYKGFVNLNEAIHLFRETHQESQKKPLFHLPS